MMKLCILCVVFPVPVDDENSELFSRDFNASQLVAEGNS